MLITKTFLVIALHCLNLEYATSNNSDKLCEDKCGDGVCQEIVCMGQGCPCPESKVSCPKDCH
jgi:hypothetical protein